MKHEKLTLSPQEIDISDIARTVLLGHGVRGAKLLVEDHPAGSHCTVDTSGTVNIVIAPKQLLGEYGEIVTDHAQAVAAHEVGHALFELASPGEAFSPTDKQEGFFRCLIQDTIIDAGQTRIPALREPIRGLYRDVILPTEFSEQPLCSQFMYGIRISQVMDEHIAIAPEVTAAIEQLRHYRAANGSEFDLLDTLTDKRTDVRAALAIANRYIKPIYDAFAEQDKQNNPEGDLGDQLGESAGQCGHSEAADRQQGENGEPMQSSAQGPSDSLPDIKQQIEQAASEAETQSGSTDETQSKEKQEDTAEKEAQAQQRQARAGSIKAELNLSDTDAEAYLSALEEYADTIREVAKVFLLLSRPTTDRQRLSYTRQRAGSGALLHHDLTNLVVSDATNQTHPFWRTIERQARRQSKSFGGLDVHLLGDVSYSMSLSGAANYAAITGLCLMEGLELARHQATKLSRTVPDVRHHIVAFGSSSKEISPLAHKADPVDTGKMFTSLRGARSNSTYVNQSIESCLGTPPARDSIIISISDGSFHDHDLAQQTVQSLPANVYFTQLILESGYAITTLTENNQTLQDPRQLPHHLLAILQQFIRRYN